MLCGAKRSGHFDGVCLVVSKLLNIVTSDNAYFGEKDTQQVAFLRRIVRNLNIGVEIVASPIIHELYSSVLSNIKYPKPCFILNSIHKNNIVKSGYDYKGGYDCVIWIPIKR